MKSHELGVQQALLDCCILIYLFIIVFFLVASTIFDYYVLNLKCSS